MKRNQYDEWEFESVDELFAEILAKMERQPRYKEVFLDPDHEKFSETHHNVARLIRYNFLSSEIRCFLEEKAELTDEEKMAVYLTEKIYHYMKSII